MHEGGGGGKPMPEGRVVWWVGVLTTEYTWLLAVGQAAGE